MDTSNSISRSPLTEVPNTTPSFEDELIISNTGGEADGSEAGSAGASLIVTGRGRGQVTQGEKKGQQTNKLSQDRQRYHITGLK